MSLAELKTDAAAHRERIGKMKLEDLSGDKLAKVVRLELCENILPLFEGLLDAIEEEVVAQIDELDQAVDELIDQSEDVLHPETTAQIVAVLEVGKLLASELERAFAKLVAEGMDDDGEQKRIGDLITAYRQSAPLVEGLLASITLDASDDQAPAQPDGDEDEDDEDAADDEEDDEDEVPHG